MRKLRWATLGEQELAEESVILIRRLVARLPVDEIAAPVKFVEDFPKIGEMAVLHTGAQNDLEHLLTRVGAIYPRERVAVLQPGPTVTCWLGREALAVAVFEGEE